MTRYARPLHDCERDYDCRFCGAERNSHCVRKVDGKRAAYPHLPRINAEFADLVKSGRIRCYGLNIEGKS